MEPPWLKSRIRPGTTRRNVESTRERRMAFTRPPTSVLLTLVSAAAVNQRLQPTDYEYE